RAQPGDASGAVSFSVAYIHTLLRFEHMPADKPPHDASRHDVRRKVLLAAEARCAHQGSESISGDYNRLLVAVPMRDYRREGKAFEGVAGRKRIASVEEVPASIPFQRPLPAGCEFEDFANNQCIGERLTAQQSRAAQFRILRH